MDDRPNKACQTMCAHIAGKHCPVKQILHGWLDEAISKSDQ